MGTTCQAFDFLSQPAPPLQAGLCVLFGQQRFLRKLVIDHFKSTLNAENADFSTIRMDADQAQWQDVSDELLAQSLFDSGGPKLVILDDADKFVSDHREQLESLLGRRELRGLLILTVDSWPSNTRLYKALDKGGLQIECDVPSSGTGKSKAPATARIAKWLVPFAAARHGVKLSVEAAHMLIELTEAELGRIDQELGKLQLYVDAKTPISAEMVRTHVGGWRLESMWGAIDAAVEGNAPEALRLIDQLTQSGEHPLALFGQLAWSLRRYGQAFEYYERMAVSGKRPSFEAACNAAGFRRGPEVAAAERRIRRLGRKRIEQLQDQLLRLDAALKRSHSHESRGRLAIEKLIFWMADSSPAKA